MTKENHPKRELSKRDIQEIELFRAILQDEREKGNDNSIDKR
jgi:hypothetical protein